MPTTSAAEPPAAAAAFAESMSWANLAECWRPDHHPAIWDDLPPIERLVVPEVDPGADLARRAQRWGYPMDRGDLSDIALFAAALAQAEGEAWASADRSVATLAYEDRRFLVSDRLLPWAVPWLRAAARCFPESRGDAEASARTLLDLGERHRPAPHLAGSEGLVPPGHDGYGPLGEAQSLEDRVGSLWGGMVVFDRSPAGPEASRHRSQPRDGWGDRYLVRGRCRALGPAGRRLSGHGPVLDGPLAAGVDHDRNRCIGADRNGLHVHDRPKLEVIGRPGSAEL